MQMKHLYGVVKDRPDHRDKLARPAAGIKLPDHVDLTTWCGPIKDQGQLGSCTAHAGTSLREFLYRKFFSQEHDQSVAAGTFRLSPLFLYAIERTIEGDFKQDGGAQSRTIFQALSKFGCCLEAQDAYDSRRVFQQPTNEQLKNALAYKAISYHRCDTVEVAKSALASGFAVTVGTPVFESFESDQVAATGTVPVPRSTETCLGGHEMLLVGYDDSHLGGAFHVQNSWGATWGDGGRCWIPYAYFQAPRVVGEFDFWTAHLGKPW